MMKVRGAFEYWPNPFPSLADASIVGVAAINRYDALQPSTHVKRQVSTKPHQLQLHLEAMAATVPRFASRRAPAARPRLRLPRPGFTLWI